MRKPFWAFSASLFLLTGVAPSQHALPALQVLNPDNSNGYSPNAISLGPTTYIKSTQIGTRDTPYGVMSWWERATTGTTANPGAGDAGFVGSIFVKDILLNLNAGGSTSCSGLPCGSENNPGQDFGVDNQSGTVGTGRLNFNDSTGLGKNHSVQALTANNYWQPLDGAWHHHLIVYDFSGACCRLRYYVDGVSQPLTYSGGQGSYQPPLNVHFSANPYGFAIGGNSGNGGPSTSDYAQIYDDTQHDPFVGGALPAGFVQKFYNKGPVNMGPTCNVLGYQPEICLDNPASSFLTNKGSSTATFSLALNSIASGMTASIRDVETPPNAPAPSVPSLKWRNVSGLGVSSGSTSMSAINGGNPIAVGDTILLTCFIAEKSTTAPSRAMTTPIGPAGFIWTPLTSMPAANNSTSGYAGNVAAYWANATTKVAAGADIAVTIPFSAGGNPHGSICNMLDYTHASSVITAYNHDTTPTYPWYAPSVTTTTPSARLVNQWMNWQVQIARDFTYPARSSVVYRRPTGQSGGVPEIVTLDEVLSGAGATGKRTLTLTGAGIPYQALSIALQP